MILHLATATAAATALALVAEPLSRRLSPAVAARLLAAAAALSALLVVWALAAVMLGGLNEAPWLAEHLGWCRPVTNLTHSVPLPAASVAAVAFALIIRRGAIRLRAWRAARVAPSADGLTVVTSEQPLAYAVPGRPGHIVASTSLLELLDAGERRAMLAHEQAHLDLRHHRYVRAAELAASVPVLSPVALAVRFATERWADEEAAAQVGDRRLVARALSRAALATSKPFAPAGAGGLVGEGMLERVEELLEAKAPPPRLVQAAVLAAAIGSLVAVGGLTVRPHDVLAVLAHFCGA